jgi:hypothetical protein
MQMCCYTEWAIMMGQILKMEQAHLLRTSVIHNQGAGFHGIVHGLNITSR